MPRAEGPAAVGRDEAPADVQLSRALIAVVLGLLIAIAMIRPVVDVPSVRTRLPELRAIAGVPTLVIRTVTGVF